MAIATLKIDGIGLNGLIIANFHMFSEYIEIRILFREKPLALFEIHDNSSLIKEMTIRSMEELFTFYNITVRTINEIRTFNGQLEYKAYLYALNYKRGGYRNELFDITVKSNVKCYKCSNHISLYHVYKELRKTANLEKELALDIIKNDIFVFMCCSCFQNNKLICAVNEMKRRLGS